MRNIRRLTSTVLCLGMALSFGASADDAAGRDLGDIRAQQLELREDVQAAKGIFEDMNPVERKQLAERQTQLLAMIEGRDTVKDLDDKTQVAAFNLLQQINATINDAEDDRLVCQSVRKTGSHRKVKVCKTVAERRQERDEAQRALDKAMTGYGPLKP